jgi:hypothetical protein
LFATLKKIIEAKLACLPIIIYDDASEKSCDFDWQKLSFKNLEFKQFTTSEGYIIRRNQIAQVIKTKYYLSLDDDSYPVFGSLKTAVEFAEITEDLLGLSFPIYNPTQNQYENKSTQQQPYQVKSFIGCGHLLHCQNFLNLGGYRAELIHQGEEVELAARAFQQNYYCYHFPDFLIHHTASNQGRNWQRMDFYGSRNNVLWNDWYVPEQLKIIKQIRTFFSRFWLMLKVRRLSLILGELAGFLNILKYKQYRQVMSMNIFKQWQNLPHS